MLDIAMKFYQEHVRPVGLVPPFSSLHLGTIDDNADAVLLDPDVLAEPECGEVFSSKRAERQERYNQPVARFDGLTGIGLGTFRPRLTEPPLAKLDQRVSSDMCRIDQTTCRRDA